jgi:hypothetical protein
MSGSSLNSIQKAIYTTLTSDSALMAKITGVFDNVPDNQPYPYITIGEATSSRFRTFSRFGEEVFITLHIWSQYAGFKEANDILNDMNRLLADQNLTTSGWDTISCFYDFSETLRDSDGVTRHIVVRYRILTQKQGGS